MSKYILEKQANQLILEIPDIINADKLPGIYFVAKAGAGKTFSANFIIKKYGYKVVKFAYPVYMIAEKYFKMTHKDRKLLQIIGTDAGRDKINSEIWVNRFKEDMLVIRETEKILGLLPRRFVIDDCRFSNEHEALKDLGFVGIYINASFDTRRKRLIERDNTAQEHVLNHKSEGLMDSFKDDLVCLNGEGGLAEYYRRLNNLLFRLAS